MSRTQINDLPVMEDLGATELKGIFGGRLVPSKLPHPGAIDVIRPGKFADLLKPKLPGGTIPICGTPVPVPKRPKFPKIDPRKMR